MGSMPDRTPRQVVNRMHLIYVEFGQHQYLTAPNGVAQTPINKTQPRMMGGGVVRISSFPWVTKMVKLQVALGGIQ